jgi:Fuc2NAc and GlcNAc transferase
VAAKLALIGVLSLLLSAALTRIVRSVSWAHGLLDVPNERSLHSATMPRGGGMSIVITATLAMLALRYIGAIRTDTLLALLVGGTAVAVIGFVDDRHRVPAGIRLAVHVAAAVAALAWLGGLPPLALGGRVVDLGWVGHALALLGIVWILNLFNFMDGIDGLAASQAVFMACGGALLSLLYAPNSDVLAAGIVIAAASLGFLAWNWPPATIFMGDVGSGYLGYVIAVLAVAATRSNPAAVWVWLILGGAFFVDATLTLVRRAMRGERVHQAHRGHAYQRLATRWGSHRRVTLAVILLNFAWLLPCAIFAGCYPRAASWAVLGALAPLIVLALQAGAGDSECR